MEKSKNLASKKFQFFTANPSFHSAGRAARDLSTIQKMARFWPPHQGYGLGEFSLVFTISLVLFMRFFWKNLENLENSKF
ncbi:hypothetical protein B9Z55_011540 [Caenorhabditis nigoni]|uniref:Uncharacterized protein n=1 Tax=Caenorhabditis nigoni TaxID=1611254 RepID=A0A2G5UKK7_9PELO|nr:hypothetical protein B9Z55_011540 [Caenorhabditis nigoni]